MENKHLHIVSFDVPYPPNYGGIIDVYFKIKALSAQGVKVHLHTFHYGRDKTPELEKICETVRYYPRSKFFQAVYSSVPYIVGSRKSDDLLSNLVEDNYPILFEGLHTCLYLNHPTLKDRLKAVRVHNIEWDYYGSLGKAERNFFRKFYLYSESKKLRQYEGVLDHADLILAISPSDKSYLEERYKNVQYTPAFHPFSEVKSNTGRGSYAIYHGNLKVPENNQAAFYLTRKIFNDIDCSLIIAGKEPLSTLIKETETNKKFKLIPNPYDNKMQGLIKDAHINAIPTFQPTGIKLKLLNALFNGRFCVVNTQMVENTGLEELCIVADSADLMKQEIKELLDRDFEATEIEKREKILLKQFSNEVNAGRLIELLYAYSPHP